MLPRKLLRGEKRVIYSQGKNGRVYREDLRRKGRKKLEIVTTINDTRD